jgi:hypothetical protein
MHTAVDHYQQILPPRFSLAFRRYRLISKLLADIVADGDSSSNSVTEASNYMTPSLTSATSFISLSICGAHRVCNTAQQLASLNNLGLYAEYH